jgi:hypothetical protein
VIISILLRKYTIKNNILKNITLILQTLRVEKQLLDWRDELLPNELSVVV